MAITLVDSDKIKVPSIDGDITLIYGHPGGGKNTYATELLLKYLRKGYLVYATWPILFDGVDEREDVLSIILGLFSLKRKYRVYPKENFHYLTLKEMMNDDFLLKLSRMADCVFAIDEAYAARLFDSYRKTGLSVEERMSVYITRHLNRKFIIVAQRANAIHVSSRGIVNRFIKCEQLVPDIVHKMLRFYIFRRTEYWDMTDESVNEEKPAHTRIKFMRYGNWLFKRFSSKYMRGDFVSLDVAKRDVYDVGYFSRIYLLFRFALLQARRFSGAAASFPIIKWLFSL